MGSTASLDFKDPAFYKEQKFRFVEDITCNRFPKGTQEHLTPEEWCVNRLDENIGEAIPNSHLFPLSCIGLLHIFKENNQSSYSIGSCFLIGYSVLLTCAHNLYTKEKKLMHYSVDYYPEGQGEGKRKITIVLNKRNCRIPQKYIDIQTNNYVNYDYAVILLQEFLIDKCGCLKIAKNWKDSIPLFLFGYSQGRQGATSLRGQKGVLTKLEENTIQYSMQTESGQSGSPIMVYEHDEWKVVGIHTLSQDARHDPSGIYLNSEICEGINSWLRVIKGELCIQDEAKLNGRELDLRRMVQRYDWNQLTTLMIEGCRLTNQSLMHLNGTTWNLAVCKFNKNMITEIVLQPDKFRKLERLYLNNNLVKRLGKQILRFKKLRKVQLNHNKLQQIDQKVIDSRLAVGYADNPLTLDRSDRKSNNYSDQ